MASHSPESLEALTAGDKEHLRALVNEHIRERREHGATVDEACQALGLLPSSVAPRFTELRKAGLIVRLHDGSGRRVKRLTRQNCWASVLLGRQFAPVESNPATFPEFGDLTDPEPAERLYRDPEEG